MSTADLFYRITKVSFADQAEEDLREPSLVPPTMRDDLLSIVSGLNAWHLQFDRGHGSIGEDSLRVDVEGRLRLRLDQFDPGEASRCQLAHKNDPNARFYGRVGERPRTADDWVALGVAAAELWIAADQRPDILPDVKAYAATIANQIRPPWWKLDRDSRCKRLIADLCLADRRRFHPAELPGRGLLLAQDREGAIRAASAMERWRSSGLIRAMVALPFLLALTAWLGAKWSGSNSVSRLSSNNQLESDVDLRAEIARMERINQELREESERIQNELSSTTEDSPIARSNEETETQSTESIRSLAMYQMMETSPGFQNERTKELMAKEELQVDEVDFLMNRIKTFEKATRTWWGWVDSQATQKQIELETAGQEESVKRVMNRWMIDAARPRRYRIRVASLQTPKDDTANFSITINGKSMTYEVPDRASEKAAQKKKSAQIELKWSLGQPIQMKLERRWTMLMYDKDLFRLTLDEAFGIHTLGTMKFRDRDRKYTLRLDVEPLSGPSRLGTVSDRADGAGQSKPGVPSKSEGTVPLDLGTVNDLVP